MSVITGNIDKDINIINNCLRIEASFDLIYRTLDICNRKACLYFIDGFVKDELLEKIIEFFYSINKDEVPNDYHEFMKRKLPYIEVDATKDYETLSTNILSGVLAIVIDGYQKAILLDVRTYPMRSISEPNKDKVFRGSRDGFVETLVANTALIRRRIRNENLTFKFYNVGKISKTDVVVAYMDNIVNKKLLDNIIRKISNVDIDSLNMNHESLAESIYKGNWFNPFPKFKYTERPDVTASALMEGHIVILVDTSPVAMILPISIFDMIEEPDDYYLPPLTGTYFRLTRTIITFIALFLTPIFLLFAYEYIPLPERLDFIKIKEDINIPIIVQFLILEIAIDGMKLASVNTPDMLNTPLSVIIGFILGDTAISSGWFNSEIMLYMAFVAFANFTHSSLELTYALKFLRIMLLVLTASLGIFGFVLGTLIVILLIAFNKTVANESYIYPLIPFNGKKLFHIFFRTSKLKANK